MLHPLWYQSADEYPKIVHFSSLVERNLLYKWEGGMRGERLLTDRNFPSCSNSVFFLAYHCFVMLPTAMYMLRYGSFLLWFCIILIANLHMAWAVHTLEISRPVNCRIQTVAVPSEVVRYYRQEAVWHFADLRIGKLLFYAAVAHEVRIDFPRLKRHSLQFSPRSL